MATTDSSPLVQAADTAAQGCAAAWTVLTGTGELLMQGQLQQAWSTLSTTVATCWNQALTAVQTALPILG